MASQCRHFEKHGIKTFRVLSIAVTAERARNLCEAAEKTLPPAARKFYLFGCLRSLSISGFPALPQDLVNFADSTAAGAPKEPEDLELGICGSTSNVRLPRSGAILWHVGQEVLAAAFFDDAGWSVSRQFPDERQIFGRCQQVISFAAAPPPLKLDVVNENFRRARGIRTVFEIVAPAVPEESALIRIEENR